MSTTGIVAENNRFKELRKHFRKNQIDWGKLLGLEQGTVSDIERCRDGASVSKHVKNILYDKLKVSPKWFEKGIPPMILEITKDNKEADSYWEKKYYSLLEKHAALLEKINNLEQ